MQGLPDARRADGSVPDAVKKRPTAFVRAVRRTTPDGLPSRYRRIGAGADQVGTAPGVREACGGRSIRQGRGLETDGGDSDIHLLR